MSQFLTIVALNKDTGIVHKVLASDRTILVLVSSVGQFRHFLARSSCDVWLCDLSMEGLDFRTDLALVRQRNPQTRVVLTGPAQKAGVAADIQQRGEASAFVAKPWNLSSLRQEIFRALPSGGGVARPPANSSADSDTGADGYTYVDDQAADTPERLSAQLQNAESKRAAGLTGRITMHIGNAENKRAAGLTGRITPYQPNVDSRRAASMTGRIVFHPGAGERRPNNRPGIRLISTKNQAPKPLPAQAPVSAATLQEPRYRLDQLLGEGGVGKVYLAYDLLLDTKVAIKILKHDFVCEEGVLQALKAEAKICMQLTHPHIVRFFDFGQRSGSYFLVMEYVPGQTLYEAMQMPESRDHGYIRNVAAAICSALSYAHAHGVLHNDITPGNVIVGTDGMLRLIDFGIASAANQHREKTAFIFGTPSYMSPEQLRCDPVLNATTDVFALGVLLHQMLTGMLPQHENATNEELALQPRPPINLLPTPLAAVLDRALAFEPVQRWHSIAEFAAAFDSALDA